MMIPDADVFVHYVKHLGNKEAVTINDDGTYSVFIDPAQSHDSQLRSYEHAMDHIHKLAFEKDNVQEIEADAHHVENPVIVVERQVIKKRRRRRKNYSREWKEINERIAFIQSHGSDYAFRRAEHEKLYGGL